MLNLQGASVQFPNVSIMSLSAFNAKQLGSIELTAVIANLSAANHWNQPFAINLRPNNTRETLNYSTPPLGLSLMIANVDSDKCSVGLFASDGSTVETLWEDTTVTHSDLADGFTVNLVVQDGLWQLFFIDAGDSLPAEASGALGELSWRDIFSTSSYLQCYLKDKIETESQSGMAKVELASLAINGTAMDYDVFERRYGLNGGPSGDQDGDGQSNLKEYAFGSDPIDPNDKSNSPSIAIEGSYYLFSQIWRRDPSGTLSVQIECSTDLVTWSTEGLPEIELQNMDEIFDKASIRVPVSSQNQFFIRSKVE